MYAYENRQYILLSVTVGYAQTEEGVNGVLTGEGAFNVASVEFKPDLFGGGDTYFGEVEQ